MMYESFAYVYDYLMDEAPYEQWKKWIITKMTEYSSGQKILDLACGTGEISVRLAREGFEVTGIDLSEDMLTVAQQKAFEAGLQISFFQMDMRELSGFEDQFDSVIICCDSLNYLLAEEDVFKALKSVYRQLKPGGILLFDIHTLYKVNERFAGHTFADNGKDVSYIWNSFHGKEAGSVDHEISFFIRQNDCYERYDELHQQRTYPLERYKKWLMDAQFQLLEVTADFTENKPEDFTERAFFVAKKPS
ncbi:class I SAM-dependent DNA methyltransferase [Metabacillus arenae]|uniref:Class I SAM-dependent methyltransferase n=1 Tax=Metabacillus arenae TaxID=2771434 RepID=A0A926NJ80_9BACI|nr:class I SAM-dependent methyltransferase [Metabacillus arenae]MBD1382075.1 class I SAM-dependent methyltransferase [Metabacillus arenae]